MIRLDLAEAQADGFDPKTLWEQALRLNEDSKYQAPTWEEVAPTNQPAPIKRQAAYVIRRKAIKDA